MKKIVNSLQDKKKNGQKAVAILIDPDKFDIHSIGRLLVEATNGHIDYFFVGGSLISNYIFEEVINCIKNSCDVPVIIFPGNYLHVSPEADAIMFLSLISGRNPDLLIGQHVIAAPVIKKSGIEVIPTGYMLIDGGKPTTVSYMSTTQPIPADKPEIAQCTAMAGEMLGLGMIYLDAGSGAMNPVSKEMVSSVAKNINIPLIVGGGLNSLSKIDNAISAGADMVVIGNGIEKNPDLMTGVSEYFQKYNALDVD